MMLGQWPTETFGELCTIFNGNSIPAKVKKEKYTIDQDGIPYIGTKDVGFDTTISYQTGVVIPSEDFASFRLAPANCTFVCAEGGSAGRKIGFTQKEVFFGNKLYAIVSGPKMDSKFIFYYCLSDSFQEQFKSRMGGMIGGVNQKKFKTIEIPVPPLEEQQRIVSILDEAFQNIEHSISQVTTKIQSAEEMFQSTLYSVFSEKGETWVDTTIGNEVYFLAGFAFKSAQYTDDQNGIKLLRGDNIIQGKLRWDGVKRWPKDEYEDYVKFALQEHDVVLAMDRPWVSAGLKFSSISQDDLPCLQVQRTARMRAGEKLHWRFLFYLIASHNFIQEMLGGQTGIGVPHISGKQIQNFSFARPPIKEQIAIAELLDSLSTNTQLLKENFEFELKNYSELRQSILQEAFTSKLTGGITS